VKNHLLQKLLRKCAAFADVSLPLSITATMDTKKPPTSSTEPLREGLDYTLDERGRFVFTRDYLMRRGHCCESGCRNCPYDFERARTGGRTPCNSRRYGKN
jgi:hypothetical protein